MNSRGIKFGIGLIMVFFFSFVFFHAPDADAQISAEQYVSDGEEALFSETVDGILEAHSIFQQGHGAYPNDPVINVYLAVTRLLELGLREDGTGLTDLLAEYGMTRSGNHLEGLEIDRPPAASSTAAQGPKNLRPGDRTDRHPERPRERQHPSRDALLLR